MPESLRLTLRALSVLFLQTTMGDKNITYLIGDSRLLPALYRAQSQGNREIPFSESKKIPFFTPLLGPI